MAGLSDYATPERLNSLANAASVAGSNAVSAATGAMTVPVKLKQALMEHYNYNEDLVKKQSEAQTQALTAASRAPDQFADVWDPFLKDKLINQYRAQELQPLSYYTGMLEQRGQNIKDIISAATPLAQAYSLAKQAEADQAKNTYNRAWDMYKQGIAEQQWQQEQARKYDTGVTDLEKWLKKIQEALQGAPTDDGGLGVDFDQEVSTSPGLGNYSQPSVSQTLPAMLPDTFKKKFSGLDVSGAQMYPTSNWSNR